MKVNLYEAGGRLEGGYTIPGMILTGPLLLSGKVSSPSEAVHKQYIDTAITNLDAANFVSGSIATARLPGFTGDVTSNNSSNVVTLNASGVIAGDYTKVTVDIKGRVTAGLSLTEADLPNIGWDKITNASKPTTLAGYGITDGVSTGNATMTGALTLAGDPTQANHAVTKAYADANVAGSSKIVTGDIIGHVANSTPSGFLRCNGGVVSKTTYSALYAVTGDTFGGGTTQPGNGKPWTQQYQFNNNQSTDITGWTTGTALPANWGDSQVIVTKNRVYLLGGYNGTWSATVYTAAINADGTLGAWTTGTSLPGAAGTGLVFVTKNRVYLAGGVAGTSTTLNTVYTAPINADGTLGAWSTSATLPQAYSQGTAIVTFNRVYIFGQGSVNVYTAVINADGTIGTWTAATALPSTVNTPQVFITKNRLYVSSNTTVHTAVINTDGTLGTWSTATPFPVALYKAQVIVTKNRVWVLGGTISNSVNTIYSAAINLDGTLGTWALSSTTLPGNLSVSQAIVTNSRVYLLGGYNGSSYTSVVYTAPFTGGLNDYSSYYNGTITVMDSNSFKLPDYTSYEKTNLYFFIKS